MQVTSMLSKGYLEPSVQLTGRAQKAQQSEASSRQAKVAGTSVSQQGEAAALSRQEQDVLAQEQSLRARAGSAAEVSTVYRYTLGPDGRRYISGASVTMKGDAEDLSRVGGGVTSEEVQTRAEQDGQRVAAAEDKSGSRSADTADKGKNGAGGGELSEGEEAQVRELEKAQREVIAHEAAHQAAAGALGGGVSYTYTQGPDGKSYITGGEVPIQLKQGSTPEETLRNMQQVQRAASAPADPSDQDQRVAAKAAAMAARAQQEIAAKGGAGQEETAKVAQGTPVAQNQQEKEDPSKNGVASVLASIREAQIQAQQLMPAA